MKLFFRNFLILCWRIWFYFLVGFLILILFPFLVVSVSHQKLYPYFYKTARIWAIGILCGMGLIPKVKRLQKTISNKSYVFVANHTSMADIMLMLYVVKKNPFVFIGKKELASIPLFGYFYRRSSILVDRSSLKSRKQVYDESRKRLQSGLSICIFPEGLVPDEEVVLARFKEGAFKLAIEHKVPIVPITFFDCKKRFSYTFFSGYPGKLRAKVNPFIETENLTLEDVSRIKKETFDLIYKDLQSNQS